MYKIGIRPQLLVALVILFGIQARATANSSTKATFKPIIKAEKCDCLGLSEDIPTFLSDLTGSDPQIYGEGATRTDASRQARNMCVESYRNFASASPQPPETISESGCQFYRSTADGDWESI